MTGLSLRLGVAYELWEHTLLVSAIELNRSFFLWFRFFFVGGFVGGFVGDFVLSVICFFVVIKSFSPSFRRFDLRIVGCVFLAFD